MPTRIYAFTDHDGHDAFQKIVGRDALQELQLVSSPKLHALVEPERSPWPWEDRRHTTALRLVHYNRVLGEAAQHLKRLLPASFESVFENTEAVTQALNNHSGEIAPLLTRYGHLRQFQLTVRWDISVMQQLLQRFPQNPNATLEKERRILRDQILLYLQGKLRDLIILDTPDRETVLQAILLIEAQDEDKMAALLQAFDKECQGRLHIRIIGPLPACNFARVDVKPPDPLLVQQARRDLGLGFSARLAGLKSAYRRKVKDMHPDQGAPLEQLELMKRLTRSYRYLTQLAAQQNPGETVNPDKQWLRCDRKALRQTPLLHIQRGLTHWDNVVIKRH